MLELLRDIRRGEEDEFDLDRNLDIAGLEGEIAECGIGAGNLACRTGDLVRQRKNPR